MPGCDPTRTNSINQTNPFNILGNINVIGANIYPYWGGSDEKIDINGKLVSVASQIQTTAMELKAALMNKDVIVTEEGWPSCSSPGQPPIRPHPTSIPDEKNYFQTWSMHTNQVFDSYYFAAYDLLPEPGCPDGANKHFGLCFSSGATKDSEMIKCGLGAAAPSFAGTPGFSNCEGQSIAALDRQYGGRNAAAAALGFPDVQVLEKSVLAFCQ